MGDLPAEDAIQPGYFNSSFSDSKEDVGSFSARFAVVMRCSGMEYAEIEGSV